MSNARRNNLKKFSFIGFQDRSLVNNGSTSNGGAAQLDEECAKVFAMDNDSMGFDFHDPPFFGLPKYGEKDYIHHRHAYPHMYAPLKIGSKSMKRRISQPTTPVPSNLGTPTGSITESPTLELKQSDTVNQTENHQLGWVLPQDKKADLDTSKSSTTDSPPVGITDVSNVHSTSQRESDSESECVLSDPCSYLNRENIEGSPERKVSFLHNENVDKFDIDGLKDKKKRKHHHHGHHAHRSKFRKYSLPTDTKHYQKENSDVSFNKSRRISTQPEDQDLTPNDRNQLDSHRSDDPRALRRPKTTHKGSLMHVGKVSDLHPYLKKLYDHSPHAIFVELAEYFNGEATEDREWKQRARWIKYEEDVEEGVDRWGKPHVASLSFHSLLNLRRCLEEGLVILDMEEKDLPGIAYRISEDLYREDLIKEEDKARVMRTLLLRHRHVNDHQSSGFRFANKKHSSLQSLWLEDGVSIDAASLMSRCSLCSQQGQLRFPQQLPRGSSFPHNLFEAEKRKVSFSIDGTLKNGDPSGDALLKSNDKPHTILDLKDGEGLFFSTSSEDIRKARNDALFKKIPVGAQGSTVLVGEVDFLEQPAIAFVRLAEGVIIPSLIEVDIPVRFIFLLLGPKLPNIDYREVGRSISTLMANQQFHNIAYKAETRKELLSAINEFLDDSIVLPPGDWERQALLPIEEIKAKSEAIKRRKENALRKAQEAQGIISTPLLSQDEEKKPPFDDPLQRTHRPWGGLIRDLKRRYPFYKSDITDGLNAQCLAAAVFMYFAAVSGAIAFGGLTGDKTENLIGISETLLCTSIGGIIFAIFAGQPMIIVGTTGALLLFDQSLFEFCKSNNIEFLATRVFVGIWLGIIGVVIAAFEGSLLVKLFTRFTEDIFSTLIVLLYILESLAKVFYAYEKHPLLANYCDSATFPIGPNDSVIGDNNTDLDGERLEVIKVPMIDEHGSPINQPNTALFCTILTFGTFAIAYYLRMFRNSQFLGRSARRALGDFGVPIAIIIMVFVDYLVPETYTEKLNVPVGGLKPSNSERRGWFISPAGVPIWIMFASVVPAVLVYILLFMETHISELIISKPERKLKKGSGIHLDIVIICLTNIICGFFGFPWLCAAAVRSIVHTSALTVMSRTHAPGEKPHLIEVKEQRMSGFFVAIFIGLSIFMAPLLRLVPMAVVLGIFLYMGVASIDGIQFFDRTKLLLMPVKHHPQASYVRKVRTLKMHLFTMIQLVCLVILWIVKSTKASLAFPFFLILLVPLRSQLNRLFSQRELRALDGDQADVDDEEPDFYAEAPLPG
ncbi:band 3 anion transport protein isoform X1 [Diorhabda sublineata]|uniref:band 3 anion transport protein isoform X1 n=2 Tax=Diorhabda sublineata TaxID=1163346 RepID=UPI0024E16013|nr:band 3 anion transport protein isoform X1 [Diorhabda sublineata]XP_056642114.1 band 3 anion transport protein isoform X1 [Diorhabda sublineata]